MLTRKFNITINIKPANAYLTAGVWPSNES